MFKSVHEHLIILGYIYIHTCEVVAKLCDLLFMLPLCELHKV